jgi:hypothetical protein
MYLGDDWDAVKQRHLAWWEGEIVDRVAMAVHAPRKDAPPAPDYSDVDMMTYWTDVDFVIEREEAQMAGTYYAGDALPCTMPFLGPVIHGAFVGCRVEFNSTRTGWQHPCIENWDDAPALTYDPDNRWWRVIRDTTRAAVESSRGRYLVEITDMGGPGDDIAALRGTQNALMDMVDRPDCVAETIETMCRLWERYLDDIHETMVAGGQTGSAGTFGIWSPGKSYTMQSDFSCMVSEAMFDRYFTPWLDWQACHLDHAIYHIDGPDAIRHIPALLAIDSIDAFNWIAGAGQGPMTRWTKLIRQIQEGGRAVQVGAAPGDVEQILKEVSPRGIFLSVRCTSEEEADDLVRKAGRWTAKYDKPFRKKPVRKERKF